MLKGFQLNRSVSKNSERQIQQNWRQNSSLPSPGLVLHFGSHTKYNRVWWDSLWKTTTWQNPADWWAFPLQLYTLFIGTGFHSLQMRGTSPSEMLSSKGLCPPLWFSSSLGHPIWFGQILLLFLNQSSWHENFTTKRPTLKQRLKIVVRLPATEHLLRSLLVMPLPVNHKNAVVTILTASRQKATEIKGSTASYPQTFSILTADEHWTITPCSFTHRSQHWGRTRVLCASPAFVPRTSSPGISWHKGLLRALFSFNLHTHLH